MKLTLLIFILAISWSLPVAAKDGTTVLITGANRGIGLELAKQYVAKGFQVIGTARKPTKAKALNALGVTVMQLDVTDPASVAAMDKALDSKSIDILINNAGYLYRKEQTLAAVDFEQEERTLAINSIGPLRVIKALIDNLQSGQNKTVINISSNLGSIENSRGGFYGYRASKSALNMFNKNLSAEFAKQGFIFTVLHPGWVQTDMGGETATLTVNESVTGLVKVISGLTTTDNGKFYDYTGKQLPW